LYSVETTGKNTSDEIWNSARIGTLLFWMIV
jgi:hypothetical protein